MIDHLIHWSLRNRAVVIFMAAALLAWGGYALRDMPLDVLPDLGAPTVTIVVEAPGMAPVEVESLVTFPIESAMNGATGVRRVRSATAVGVAVVWVEFEWGEDIHRARQIVAEKLNTAAVSLPAGVRQPFLAPVSSIMGEILFLALESDRHTPLELRTIAETLLRRRLLAVPGVSQVIPTGGEQKQYQVLVEPYRLREYDVTLAQVEDALRRANRNSSAGFRVSGGQEYLIQGVGRVSSADEIGQIVVATHETRPILVRDLAEVRIGEALKRGEGSHNARPAVILGIQKQPGANTLELTRRLDATLDEMQRTLPAGMKIDRRVMRQADFIERAVDNLVRALRDGAVLVVVVVVIFLMNARAAVITLAALPLSLLTAVVAMKEFGLSINSMTLGGLAIAVGELVDDAIIDVENVVRRLRENAHQPAGDVQPGLEVIYRASTEIRGSIVFATLIVVIVFTPLFLLGSVEGRLLRPLGFAYIVALAASLLVALTVTPALCSVLLPNARSIIGHRESWVMRRLKAAYRPTVEWALNHSGAVMALSALLLIGALAMFPFMGRSFLPEFNEGMLTIGSVTLPGTSLEQSDQLGRALERLLLTVPEVASVGRRTGRAELDEHVQGVEASELDVMLRPGGRPKEVVLADVRAKAKLLPGTIITVGQPISHRIDHMLSGSRASIAVKIFGDDLGVLRTLGTRVQQAMATVPGVVDLSVEQQTDIPTVRVRIDQAAAARFGLPAGEVTDIIQTAYTGKEVSRVLEGQFSFPLIVRYRLQRPAELREIAQTSIDTPPGAKVPLAAVAHIAEDRGPNFIMREGVQRKLTVSCNVAGRDLRGAVSDIQNAISRSGALPPGYRIEYGGQFESEAQASRQLLLLGVGVIAAILIILTSAFGSLRDALIIMVNLPLALVGGVAGVFLAGGILSVASTIGFITLFGIATRNGIMLISHVRHLLEAEHETDLRAAIVRGATERVSPIFMTAMAAGLALAPIAMGVGRPGSEIQAPMAMVILAGLATSTALNMVVVPAVYWRYRRTRRTLSGQPA
ncbi:MAG: efflux RND transporter permease subunit [Acidobacteria bacterium]|nr:efflux RND transporter permease subunit [Acidobacteriota bacterium]MBI3282020.1 efflux RND transporter permease subunit [Acidobacteriota bacterium]